MRSVSIFVILSLFSAAAMAEEAAPVSFLFRMAGEAVEQSGIEPYAAVGSVLEYNFYKSYVVGVEFAYFRPFNQFDDHAIEGTDDLGLYLMDKSLWTNRYWDMNLSVKGAVVLPTSLPSQQASMSYGGYESAIFKKGWGGGFSTTYMFTFYEYYYQYGTAQEDATGTVYNTQYSFLNRIIASWDFIRYFHWDSSASNRTYHDYDNTTYNITTFATGLTYDFDKNASIDFGVRTAIKQSGANDPWNGPYTSSHIFGPDGTIFYIGTTLHI